MKVINKIASLLLMSAVIFSSCDNKAGGDDVNLNDVLYISSDKNVIQSNDTDAAVFTAVINEKDVTAETVFYLVEGEQMTPLAGNMLKVSKAGVYSVKASYKTFITTEAVTVNAINMEVPAPVEESAADAVKTSFVHRAFLNQYTGTGCGYCPGMIRALRKAFEDPETADMAVLAAVHSYGAGDPAYIGSPRSQSYPYLHIDMVQGFTYDMDPYAEMGVLKNALKERTASPAKVGIAANPIYKDGVLVVTVSVKAANDGEYNLGVWFLQDNVYGQQTDNIGIVGSDKSYHYHDNCVRAADSRYLGMFTGHPMGRVAAGQTVSRTFVLNVNETDWKLKDLNDLHFAAFVTETVVTETGKGKKVKSYPVVNVVDCRYNEPTPYDYK